MRLELFDCKAFHRWFVRAARIGFDGNITNEIFDDRDAREVDEEELFQNSAA